MKPDLYLFIVKPDLYLLIVKLLPRVEIWTSIRAAVS
jgi:hypothetical protein